MDDLLMLWLEKKPMSQLQLIFINLQHDAQCSKQRILHYMPLVGSFTPKPWGMHAFNFLSLKRASKQGSGHKG